MVGLFKVLEIGRGWIALCKVDRFGGFIDWDKMK